MDIDKRQYVTSLEKVKLVIGNGFDLHCKLYSSYHHYLLHFSGRYNHIKEIICQYRHLFDSGKRFVDKECIELNKMFNYLLWEYFFGLYNDGSCATSQGIKWFDIETLILLSLKNENNMSPISWPKIYSVVQKGIKPSDFETDFVASIVMKKHNGVPFKSESDFYYFLLDDLIEFEAVFGRFIENQRVNLDRRYYQLGLQNKKYFICANDTLELLCNKEKVVSIDNFNFDNIGFAWTDAVERHINGDCDKPIFGVDSVFNFNDPRNIFTKTSRRMFGEMMSDSHQIEKEYENVVIYGHSLDKADYSYFFPLLDKLMISDVTKTGIIVFAYTIFDESKKDELILENKKMIAMLFENYAKYKHMDEPERLLDYLSISHKIVMYEIPELIGNKYEFDSYFDDKEYKD